MAKTPVVKTTPTELEILQITRGVANIKIIGEMPLYYNRMSEKAKRDLLVGGQKKTLSERAQTVKHNPPEEFRNSVYRNPDGRKTRLAFPAPAFKGAMMTAALEIPGARKSEVGRLVWVRDQRIDMYGIPFLKMDVVRSADINKTPDIRTRAIVSEWACELRIAFIQGKLNETGVINLLHAAGLISGVGDFRQEKGKGSYGQFRLVQTKSDEEDYDRIVETGGVKQQDAALAKYTCYDEETQELLDFYSAHVLKIGRQPVSASASVEELFDAAEEAA